jgi:hypothetical protein
MASELTPGLTVDLVAEPAAQTEHARPAPRPRSMTFGLLRLTGGLFAAYWPVLFFWFLLQHVTHRPLLDASVQLGLFNRPLGFLGLAILVVVQLLCTIAMFQALRPGMSSLADVGDGLRARVGGNSVRADTVGAANRLGNAVEDRVARNFADAIAVALLPFFAYYATWGLLRDIVGQYSYELLRHIAGLGLPGPLDIIKAPGLWVTIAITYVVRRISVERHDRTKSPWWSILATICEAYWVFLGVLAIASYKQMPWDWWHHRVVYVEWQHWWDNPRDVLGPIKRAIEPVLALGMEGIRVAILPLVWLAIAAIVYGHDVRAPGDVTESPARVTRLHARYARLPRVLQWIAESSSDGWRKKALPVVNSLRLLLRAGLRPALALCVCYVALHFVCSWAFRGAVWLIGPHDRDAWNVILGPLMLLVGDMSGQTRSLIQEPLRICLLAAAVEVTLRENRR